MLTTDMLDRLLSALGVTVVPLALGSSEYDSTAGRNREMWQGVHMC